MQAPTGVSGTHSLPNSAAVVRRLQAGHDVAADAVAATSAGGASSHSGAMSIAKRRRASRCAHSSRRRRLPSGTCAMPRQRPPTGWNTCQSCALRGEVALLRHAARVHVRRPAACRRGRARRASPGRPGCRAARSRRRPPARRWRSTKGSKMPQPVMVAAWPAARKPSMRVSGISRDDLHHRRDVLVRREHGEVRRRLARARPRRWPPRWSRSRWRRTRPPRRSARASSTACVDAVDDVDLARRRPARRRATRPCRARAACRRRWRRGRPGRASATASSTSGMSVTHTGQPGPMMTSSSRGKHRAQAEAGDRLLVAAAHVHHRHRRAADGAAVARRSAATSARARAGSRNSSCAASRRIVASRACSGAASSSPRTSAAIRSSVAPSSQQLLVERQRRGDVVRRDAADGEAHVIQDVVARRDRLVDESSRTCRRTPQKSTVRRRCTARPRPPCRGLRDTCRTCLSYCLAVRRPTVRASTAEPRDRRLPERDAAVAGRHVAVRVYRAGAATVPAASVSVEPCVLEAAAGEHDRAAPVLARRRAARRSAVAAASVSWNRAAIARGAAARRSPRRSPRARARRKSSTSTAGLARRARTGSSRARPGRRRR